MPVPAAPATVRVFFALWPEDAARGALAQLATGLRQACGGRAAPVRNIHLTLAFLGNLERVRLSQLREHASTVAAPAFELRIDIVEYWPRNRIVWAGPRACPDALRALVSGLERMLKVAGFAFDQRPYAPHVTLLRNARRAPGSPEAGDIAWPVREFVLVRSVRRAGGPEYDVIGRWPLDHP